MFLPVFVCLSVCLLARLLKNAFMDLDEILYVDRRRYMDELINFWARSGLETVPNFTFIGQRVAPVGRKTHFWTTEYKHNTGMAALCAGLPVINSSLHPNAREGGLQYTGFISSFCTRKFHTQRLLKSTQSKGAFWFTTTGTECTNRVQKRT